MGFCLGFGAIAVISLGLGGFSPDIRTILVGRDISLSGGSRIVLRGARDTWTQTCNGVCDDLVVLSQTADLGYAPTVYDAKGRYVLRESSYLDGGKATRTISGHPKLDSKVIWNLHPASSDRYWPIGKPGS